MAYNDSLKSRRPVIPREGYSPPPPAPAAPAPSATNESPRALSGQPAAAPQRQGAQAAPNSTSDTPAATPTGGRSFAQPAGLRASDSTGAGAMLRGSGGMSAGPSQIAGQPPAQPAANYASPTAQATPGLSVQRDRRPVEVNTSGAVRQRQYAELRDPLVVTQAPINNNYTITGDYNGGHGEGSTPIPPTGNGMPAGFRAKFGSGETPDNPGTPPPASPPPATPPAAPPAAPPAGATPPVTATPPAKPAGGGLFDVTDASGNEVSYDQARAETLARDTGMTPEEAAQFYATTGATSVQVNPDTGMIESYTVIAGTYDSYNEAYQAVLNGEGSPDDIVKGADGKWTVQVSRDFTEQDRNRIEHDAANAPPPPSTGEDPSAIANSIIDEALGREAPVLSEDVIDKYVEDYLAQNAYQQGRTTLQSMEASARSGLSADASAGMTNEIGTAYGLQGAQRASEMRLEMAKSNLQAQMAKYAADLQLLQQKAAFAQSAVDRAEALKQAKALSKIQGDAQRRLMLLDAELNAPNAGDVIGGLLTSIAGGATMGLTNHLLK